ncbi:helix-turn-helix transcriptional regulator [Agromyces italicus]|uniref:helix-turn-helix transcriptional regulator n=1 Tax=Agromyces italicus TaxID=279572 RepID=UPI00041A1CEE|nr:WYL domain-containing protein [Agromyces italicus]
MTDPTARTLQLLELLQSSDRRTVTELADRLAVDERTVRRDVARLIRAGVHVESLRGRLGGYRLAPGRSILPITFGREEVVSVFLGLAHAQAASGEPEVAVQTAMSKIKRAMRPEEAKGIDIVLAEMSRSGHGGVVMPDPAMMLVLAEAVNRRRVVDLRYRDRDGVPSRRRVEPHGLHAHGGRWYLVAFDTEKRGQRTFRLDRIGAARPLPETFAPPATHDAATRLVDHFADADRRWTVVLLVRAAESVIRVHLPPSVARLELVDPAEDDAHAARPPLHRVEIHAESLDWIPPVIAALDCEVVVDRPDELRDRLRAAAARMLRAASDAAG